MHILSSWQPCEGGHTEIRAEIRERGGLKKKWNEDLNLAFFSLSLTV